MMFDDFLVRFHFKLDDNVYGDDYNVTGSYINSYAPHRKSELKRLILVSIVGAQKFATA